MITEPSTIRILLVEDVATEAELELRELKRAGMRLESRIVSSEAEFRAAMDDHCPDIILSDFSMPGWDGMSALASARQLCPDTPFIFVSGTLGEEYAIRALKNGAADYVLKTNLVRLPAAVERALAEARERVARRSVESELDATRERLHSIFNTVDDVLWSIRLPSMQAIYISPSAEALYGHPLLALMADEKLSGRMTHPDDREKVAAGWQELMGSGRIDLEYRIVRPDGSVRWIHARGRAVGGAAGQPERADGIMRDVTERMEQRERIARLSRVRLVLSSINAALIRLRDRQLLFDEACRIAVEDGGFIGAHVAVAEPASQQIVVIASRGVKSLAKFPLPLSVGPHEREGMNQRALRTGEPVISNDLSGLPVMFEGKGLVPGTRSVACFPIAVDREVVGVFVIRAEEKDFFDQEEVRLLRTVSANIGFALELIAKQEQLNYLAYYDALTGLPNRTLFKDRLSQVLASAQGRQSMVALIIFDVDRFKVVNDTLGQPAGDQLLQLIAGRLRGIAPDAGRLARLAADRFTVLLPTVRDEAAVVRLLAQRATALFDEPFTIDGTELRVAAKAGIALYPSDGADADMLFLNAEAALKRAKSSGERYLFYSPQINARVAGRLNLENRLRKAVEERQFVLHYQPKVDLLSRRCIGLEALIRWNDPQTGLIPPGEFIPILEETGLIGPVGCWAMEEAVRVFRGWKARGLKPPHIAVNVSPVQLRTGDLVGDIRVVIGGDGKGAGLDLEITESLLMEDIEESILKLRALRDFGIRISVDDFGTGYSSLSYIHKLPIDTLKIDRSFIAGMTEDADKTSIVSTIISLAQSLRLKVVAEGVETEPQAQLLRLLRCDQIQGFLISPAVPAGQAEAFFSAPTQDAPLQGDA